MEVLIAFISALILCAYAQLDPADEEKIEEILKTICEDTDVRSKLGTCLNGIPEDFPEVFAKCTDNPNGDPAESLNYYCKVTDSEEEEKVKECLMDLKETESKDPVVVTPEQMEEIAGGCMDIIEYGIDQGWVDFVKGMAEKYKPKE